MFQIYTKYVLDILFYESVFNEKKSNLPSDDKSVMPIYLLIKNSSSSSSSRRRWPSGQRAEVVDSGSSSAGGVDFTPVIEWTNHSHVAQLPYLRQLLSVGAPGVGGKRHFLKKSVNTKVSTGWGRSPIPLRYPKGAHWF